MDVLEFVHLENLKLYKKQLMAPTNEAQRRQLLTLLTEERGKDQTHPNVCIATEWSDAAC